MSAELHKRQDGNKKRPACDNVLLYHSNFPILRVEQGTTFGLTKMLYESIGGQAKIIGLKQRHSLCTLPCFITHDQTVLTEREYDIILYGKLVPDNLEYGTSHKEDKIDWADCNENITPSIVSEERRRWVIQYSRSHEIEPQSGNDQTDERPQRRDSSPCSSTSSSTSSTEISKLSTQDLPSKVRQRQSHERKWQCSYCAKFLLCRSAYENHLRTHTGEKPFQCDVCRRRFGNNGNLLQHMHIHRDVKPHICQVCGRGFTRSNRLREHRRLHHQPDYELYPYSSVLNFAKRRNRISC